MRIGAVVQARMGSARLPGKVLMPLAGRPAIEYLLERLGRAQRIGTVIVATSREPADDPVAEYCDTRSIGLFRGAHDDVAARLVEAAEEAALDAFVRVNGDSPLLDQALVDQGVDLFGSAGVDIVTNVLPRTFPRGQSVEVIRTLSLRGALARLTSPEDREHVTSGIYRDPGGLVIENFTAGTHAVGPDGGAARLVLDTPEDAELLERVLRALARPHWQYGWRELVELARAQAALR